MNRQPPPLARRLPPILLARRPEKARRKISTRTRLGVALLIASPLVAIVLYACHVPLVSIQDSQRGSSPEVEFILVSCQLHWPLVMVFITGFLGVICFAWPKRKPPPLAS